MADLIQAVYPWTRNKVALKKKNQDLGNIISLNFIFLYLLLFLFVTSGKIYPILRQIDINILGYISSLVLLLRYLVFNWWISVLLFLFSVIIMFLFVELITRTNLRSLKIFIEYLKIDTKSKSKKTVILIILRDILEIGFWSIISFIFLELVTFATSSLIVTLILPITLNITEISLNYVFLTILIVHIVFFPLLMYFYNKLVKKKITISDDLNIKDFLTEEGEVDMDKWREETWGKKPYTFDREKEDVFPITCFSCGSIISSDLTVCPICDTDLVKEIEVIDTELEDEDDFEEKTNKEEKNNS